MDLYGLIWIYIDLIGFDMDLIGFGMDLTRFCQKWNLKNIQNREMYNIFSNFGFGPTYREEWTIFSNFGVGAKTYKTYTKFNSCLRRRRRRRRRANNRHTPQPPTYPHAQGLNIPFRGYPLTLIISIISNFSIISNIIGGSQARILLKNNFSTKICPWDPPSSKKHWKSDFGPKLVPETRL